ncbi:hypothetical protein PR048_014439 [Dryococelus australis]|uniref:Uncharacterized protein n=1 Tax=Dryococelus australis TaxID=614101 RepID=A0ABQ9HE83_9NEOP|nr:hypothetical protein PR048_014439 [Dryococelus australis]
MIRVVRANLPTYQYSYCKLHDDNCLRLGQLRLCPFQFGEESTTIVASNTGRRSHDFRSFRAVFLPCRPSVGRETIATAYLLKGLLTELPNILVLLANELFPYNVQYCFPKRQCSGCQSVERYVMPVSPALVPQAQVDLISAVLSMLRGMKAGQSRQFSMPSLALGDGVLAHVLKPSTPQDQWRQFTSAANHFHCGPDGVMMATPLHFTESQQPTMPLDQIAICTCSCDVCDEGVEVDVWRKRGVGVSRTVFTMSELLRCFRRLLHARHWPIYLFYSRYNRSSQSRVSLLERRDATAELNSLPPAPIFHPPAFRGMDCAFSSDLMALVSRETIKRPTIIRGWIALWARIYPEQPCRTVGALFSWADKTSRKRSGVLWGVEVGRCGGFSPWEPCFLAVSSEADMGKREIPEKTRRPAASSGTIPTCVKAGNEPRGEYSDRWTTAAPADVVHRRLVRGLHGRVTPQLSIAATAMWAAWFRDTFIDNVPVLQLPSLPPPSCSSYQHLALPRGGMGERNAGYPANFSDVNYTFYSIAASGRSTTTLADDSPQRAASGRCTVRLTQLQTMSTDRACMCSRNRSRWTFGTALSDVIAECECMRVRISCYLEHGLRCSRRVFKTAQEKRPRLSRTLATPNWPHWPTAWREVWRRAPGHELTAPFVGGSSGRPLLDGGKPGDSASAVHTKLITSLSATALLNGALRNVHTPESSRPTALGRSLLNWTTPPHPTPPCSGKWTLPTRPTHLDFCAVSRVKLIIASDGLGWAGYNSASKHAAVKINNPTLVFPPLGHGTGHVSAMARAMSSKTCSSSRRLQRSHHVVSVGQRLEKIAVRFRYKLGFKHLSFVLLLKLTHDLFETPREL